MATTTMARNGTARSVAPTASPSPPVRARAVTRRSTARIVVGIVVMGLCGLAAMVVFSSAADRTAAVVVVRDVPSGQAVTEADLGTASVSVGRGVHTVPAGQATTVVGQTALVDLPAGSLLNPTAVGPRPPLAAGTVVAAAVLTDGQAPVDLAVGDVVEIVESTGPDTSGSGVAVSRGRGEVLAIGSASDTGSDKVVSLAVPSDGAADVSAAGAGGRLSLVVSP